MPLVSGGGGGGSGSGGDGAILDGADATVKATVLDTLTQALNAGDNPLLVRALVGDETSIVDLLVVASNAYITDDVFPGARNLLMTATLLYGLSEGVVNGIRPASILDGISSAPGATDNCLLVRSIVGDPTNPITILGILAAGYSPADITPATGNWVQNVSLLVGPASGTNTAVRPASVLDGIAAAPAADDNPLLVQDAAPRAAAVNAGGISLVTTATPTDIVVSNVDRKYVEIQNLETSGGETLYLKLGADAGAGDGYPVAPGDVFYLGYPAIFTGRVSIYHAKGSDLSVGVLEF